jgi:Flp pilus assembly protein TadB
LGPTQPPGQWDRRLFPREQSGRDMKLTTHLHLLVRVHGVMLYVLSTGTPVPLAIIIIIIIIIIIMALQTFVL